MTKRAVTRSAILLLLGLFAMVVLAGCETCKGAGRDIHNADQWIKDNLW